MRKITNRRRFGSVGFVETVDGFQVLHGLEKQDCEWFAETSFHFDTVEEAAYNYATVVSERLAKSIIQSYYDNKAK